MKKEDFQRPLIGILRVAKKPNHTVLAAAYAAEMIECDLIFFNPNQIDFEKNEVKGLVYEQGKWIKKTSRFPNVIDNSPPKKKYREIYEQIEERIPLTMRRIGNKDKVNKRILDESIFSHLIIPYEKLGSLEEGLQFLNEHEKIVIKPAGGNQGENIYYVHFSEGKYTVKGPKVNKIHKYDSFVEWLKPKTERNFIVQKYVDSLTINDIPFDVRIHIRRGREAKWNVINMYVRVGNGEETNITSNVSQGGSISKLAPFLKTTFPSNWKKIKRELEELAEEFPPYFQKGYTHLIDALGLDVGIDCNGKLWLFEVNSYPGSTSFELKSQIAAMEYAKFLSEKRKQKIERSDSMVTIARLGFSNKPIIFTRALAYIAKAKNVTFFSFTPNDIDTENKQIFGTYLDGEEWKVKKFPYPDYIYDRVLARGRKYHRLYEELAHIPFNNDKTPGGSMNKNKMYEIIEKGKEFTEYLIPYVRVKDLRSIQKELDKHKKVICKSETGSRGLSVHYFEKEDSGITVKIQKEKMFMNQKQFDQFVTQNIIDKNRRFILQPFIESVTNSGNPFDLRAHLMKNSKGEWSIAKIYPRIGVLGAPVSNLHLGGSICDLNTFLTKHITIKNQDSFKRKLRKFTLDFVSHLEQNIDFNFCEVGLDIAIDENEKLWLFEVNMNQINIQYLRFEAAEHVINYGKYVARNKVIK